LLKKRLIPVLILREGQVVQSVQFKHTNVIHSNPSTAVDFFNTWDVDEIILLDVSRNLEKRKKFYDAVDALSKICFVPLTVGGWITDTGEVNKLLRLGADKIVINTEAYKNPKLISDCAKIFGSQCIVISIDAKRNEKGEYDIFLNRGQGIIKVNPAYWAKNAQKLGAGEIFLNCIDNDGNRQGYAIDLVRSIVDAVEIPVIAMGGVMEWQHLVDGIKLGGADAVAAANIFHYTEHSTKKAKEYLRSKGIDVR